MSTMNTRRPSTSWLAEVGRKPSFGGKPPTQTVAGVYLPDKLDLRTPRSNSFSTAPASDEDEILYRQRQQFGLSKLREVDDCYEPTTSKNTSNNHGAVKVPGFDSPTEQLQYQLGKNLARRNTSALSGFQQFAFSSNPLMHSDDDHAIDDIEETLHDPRTGPVRRYSEHTSIMNPHLAHNRPLERFKNPVWQAGNGLGNTDGSQTRRHSFAHLQEVDPRTRQPSTGVPHPLRDSINNDDDGISQVDIPQSPGTVSATDSGHHSDQPFDSRECGFSLPSQSDSLSSSQSSASSQHLRAARKSLVQEKYCSQAHPVDEYTAGYFTGHGVAARMLEQSNSPLSMQMLSARSPQNGTHSSQVLVMVSFKCARADVYYIPENTGLEVRKGDVVIVEGDRGHDLGTVTHVDIPIQEAKRLKIEAMEEHHKWLIMFSRYFQQHSANLSSFQPTQTSQGRMLGAMAGHGQIAVPENVDVKPRMIKRIAGVYEIQKLQEKEGAEAKAKRLCQQKVAEHGLPMEILDAEYQLDHKKLTFYFFAERYIDFNNLVSELFKIYKTRIWMSAVNPASFPHPVAPRPSAIGPGATLHENTYPEPSAAPTSALNPPHLASGLGPGFGGLARGAPARPFEAFSRDPRSAATNGSPSAFSQHRFTNPFSQTPAHGHAYNAGASAAAHFPGQNLPHHLDTRPLYEGFHGLSLEPRTTT